MKKHYFLVILLLTFCSKSTIGQTWAPLGAEWHYSFNNFWVEGYVKIHSIEDTIINSINCKKLEKTRVVFDHLTGEIDTTLIGVDYMYSDTDKVYIYINNQFYTLYDFSANIGDSWVIPRNEDIIGICDDEGEIIVVDTGHVSINTQYLRTIRVESISDSHWSFIPGDIIERIGPGSAYMLPEPTVACILDVYEGGPLRCYEDDAFGLYSTGIFAECDYVVSIPEKELSEVSIFPNPCKDFLHIELADFSTNHSISIIDVYGNEVFNSFFANSQLQLNMAGFSSGIYFLRISSNTNVINCKIIKR